MAKEIDVAKPASELDAFLREFEDCAIAPTRRLIAAYVKGQLGPLPRKSVMPIARAAGIAPRTLQELLSLHRWDEELLRERVQRRALRLLGGSGITAVIHATGVPKRGLRTPGVDRQRNPSTGRVSNCCVIVHLTLAAEAQEVLFDGELYLPRSWTARPDRLRQAGIPAAASHRSEAQIGLELIDRALAAGVRPRWVLFDPSMSLDPGFLAGLDSRGLRYVTELPGDFRGSLEGRPPAGREPGTILEQVQGRILRRLFRLPSLRAKEEVGAFPMEVFPFVPAAGFGGGTTRSLIALRHPWSGGFRFFLGSEPPGEGEELALQTALSREDLKASAERDLDAVGFGHFEVRAFLSLRRHLRLSEASLLFRSEQGARPLRAPRAAAP